MSKATIPNLNQHSRTSNGSRKKSTNPTSDDATTQEEGASNSATDQASKSASNNSPNITAIPSRKRLYVSNLKWQITESRLREEFSKFGQVTEARVVRDRRSGWSRGFGFVSFVLNEAATKAMETLNGTELEGRLVRIEFARSSGPQQRQNPYCHDDVDDDNGSGTDQYLSNATEQLDYTGLESGYCVPIGHPYAAYIPAPGQYVDPHLFYPSAYYQPNPVDLVVHQMQMMSFDPTQSTAPPSHQRQQKTQSRSNVSSSTTSTQSAENKEREDAVGEQL